jgi:hypothetical protein
VAGGTPSAGADGSIVVRRAPGDEASAASRPDGGAAAPPALPPATAPAAAAPEVDVQRLADRVFDLLMARLATERQRRGL